MITLQFTPSINHKKNESSEIGEDTYGWNFKAIKGNKFLCTLLIIND